MGDVVVDLSVSLDGFIRVIASEGATHLRYRVLRG
jgi:hypothetical protein